MRVAFASAVLVISPLGLVFFLSPRQWRRFGELGFFTKLRHRWERSAAAWPTQLSGRWKLLALAGSDWNSSWSVGRCLPCGIWLRADQFSPAILADVLNGIPSITWGIVVYGLVVLRFKGFSGYAGGLALSLIMIPLILRTTEESSCCAEWLSRGGARARSQPVENDRTYCDEDCVQGNHHRNSLALARRGRRNSAPSFYGLSGTAFGITTLANRSLRFHLQILPMRSRPNDDLASSGLGRRAGARHGRFLR